jgi:hypothetical protein
MTKEQKKRVGPSHRVREMEESNDPYPFPNDALEWLVVTVALTAIGIGAYVMYYLSDMS